MRDRARKKVGVCSAVMLLGMSEFPLPTYVEISNILDVSLQISTLELLNRA